jgi:hypothetical protein
MKAKLQNINIKQKSNFSRLEMFLFIANVHLAIEVFVLSMNNLCARGNFYIIRRQVIFPVARYYHPKERGFLFLKGNITGFFPKMFLGQSDWNI